MTAHHLHQSPLATRYASQAMSSLFSAQTKHSTWRRLWIALAEAEQELGLPITPAQIAELKAHIDDIDFVAVDEYEKQLHHDVMAHIHAYADQCPEARPIIHLGATSCFVTDNTELIQMRNGIEILKPKLALVIKQLAHFAKQYRATPCLGYTHLQPAQLTTVGKRTCLWIQDFVMDLNELNYRLENLRFLGAKGTTGTQASFLALFDQDHDKVEKLDQLIAKKMDFTNLLTISGQTYTRKQDIQVLSTLSSLAAGAHKFATDLRLLAHLNEVEEPFGKKQVGSSAMPYKRNPILSERVCSLARFIISLLDNPLYTAATQWLERTLDDSANRRLSISEAFLATDALLNLLITITSDLTVYPNRIQKHIEVELPFMATENILMAAVKKGGDRQDLHEKIRTHSHAAAEKVKVNGDENDLLQRISQDSSFHLNNEELTQIVNMAHFIGRAPQQVDTFLKEEVDPIIQQEAI